MNKAEILALADRVSTLCNPDQGMSYHGGHHGERRYDNITGKPYTTRSQPATLTVYSSRANTIMDVIKQCETVASALRAHAEDMD